MSHSPQASDQEGCPDRGLTGHDRTDRDHMIGVRGVTHSEKKAKQGEGENRDHEGIKPPRRPRGGSARPGATAVAASGRVLRSVTSPYGMIVCGGTIEIVFLQTVESIRQGPDAPPRAGIVIRVVPVVTLAGTCVGSPFASVSSAAREQFPSVIVHQFLVMV